MRSGDARENTERRKHGRGQRSMREWLRVKICAGCAVRAGRELRAEGEDACIRRTREMEGKDGLSDGLEETELTFLIPVLE